MGQGKRGKENKHIGAIVLILIAVLVVVWGSYLGYSIAKSDAGIKGVLADALQNEEKLEDLDTINVLLLRSERRYWSKTNRYNYGLFI